jgi:hypothetical protein
VKVAVPAADVVMVGDVGCSPATVMTTGAAAAGVRVTVSVALCPTVRVCARGVSDRPDPDPVGVRLHVPSASVTLVIKPFPGFAAYMQRSGPTATKSP